VIGAFLNGLGLLAGALFGFTARAPLSLRAQYFFKTALGVFTVWFGLRLIGENVHGTFFTGLKQLLLAALGVVLGYWLGQLLRLQTLSNRLGHYAANRLAGAQKNPPGKSADGLAAVTILFCAAPLGIVGAVTDGLSGYYFLLLLKAVMDGLAMTSFVKIFRWPVVFAVVPVVLFLNGLTLVVRTGAAPWLAAHGLIPAVQLAAGLITCTIALVIFEIRRVELNNYLPGLVVAPLLAHFG
jgi:uncharacterized protein